MRRGAIRQTLCLAWHSQANKPCLGDAGSQGDALWLIVGFLHQYFNTSESAELTAHLLFNCGPPFAEREGGGTCPIPLKAD